MDPRRGIGALRALTAPRPSMSARIAQKTAVPGVIAGIVGANGLPRSQRDQASGPSALDQAKYILTDKKFLPRLGVDALFGDGVFDSAGDVFTEPGSKSGNALVKAIRRGALENSMGTMPISAALNSTSGIMSPIDSVVSPLRAAAATGRAVGDQAKQLVTGGQSSAGSLRDIMNMISSKAAMVTGALPSLSQILSAGGRSALSTLGRATPAGIALSVMTPTTMGDGTLRKKDIEDEYARRQDILKGEIYSLLQKYPGQRFDPRTSDMSDNEIRAKYHIMDKINKRQSAKAQFVKEMQRRYPDLYKPAPPVMDAGQPIPSAPIAGSGEDGYKPADIWDEWT
jgi:hypothetical protein